MGSSHPSDSRATGLSVVSAGTKEKKKKKKRKRKIHQLVGSIPHH
jgi:hypothetical protein